MERIVVGVSGASGIPIAVELLKAMKEIPEIESHMVMTDAAAVTLQYETGLLLNEFRQLADVFYENTDIAAPVASGSFKTSGMVVVPCSMKTIAGIASGYSDNLLLRAADVTLKERRPLILVARECPLGTLHLENMTKLSHLGAVIMPPIISYYHQPQTVLDITRHMVGKILDSLGYDYKHFRRWGSL